MNQKGFVNIILVVVIVVLVGAVGYFALVRKPSPIAQQSPIPTPTQTKTSVSSTPTPNKISTWKTYASTKYGFEFKYPGNWQFNSNPMLSSPDSTEFYVIDTSNKQRVRLAVSSDYPSILNDYKYGQLSVKSIGGISAQEIISKNNCDAGECSGPTVELWTKKNNHFFSFIFYGTQDVSGIYDQILSTFKFTNSASKDEFTKVTIDALAHNPSNFLNKKVQITGKLILTGKNYFTDPRFAMTDGVNQFQISAWLVLEVPPPMPGSTEGQPSTVATYLGKTLTLQGVVEQNDQGFFLRVTTAP